MKTVAIIQARVRSSRLPGKVLASIAGRPMLWHVVDRVRQAHSVDQTAVATSLQPADDVIAAFCRQQDIPCTRGSETDVLDRYHQAACELDASTIVRITSDCPLIDPAVIDAVIGGYFDSKADYGSNIAPPTFPDGLDTEVFSWQALHYAWSRARKASDREHVTPYMRTHPETVRAANIVHDHDLSDMRWTVDTLEDLAFVRAIFHALDDSERRMQNICRLLADRPQLLLINAGHERNEGYLHSLSLERDARQRQAA